MKVSLSHRTKYDYGRPVNVGTQTVRLRPAQQNRTRIDAFSLEVSPTSHLMSWQKDAFGNAIAQIVLLEKTDVLELTVKVTAQLEPYNPFDFSLEPSAREWPFAYRPIEFHNVQPYLDRAQVGEELASFLARVDRTNVQTIDFLVQLNQLVYSSLIYETRLEEGVQTPAQTLRLGKGSCRDSAWLLVELCRQLGLAARFVSGYLVELAPEAQSVEPGALPIRDSMALHAWADVYVPGAGWVGLDATSGLFTAEGHIPLAWSPSPEGAAPVEGLVEKGEAKIEFEMTVERFASERRGSKL